jgi:SAM-dependent methyltransferase
MPSQPSFAESSNRNRRVLGTNVAKTLAHRLGRAYCREVCRREYNNQQFVRVSERPIEYRFVFEQLTQLNAVSVLDVGTGTTALPQLIRTCGFLTTAIDNIQDYWPEGMFNRHYHIINDDITDTRLGKTFDVITCISVLEHIANHDAAMRSMVALLNPGGHLIVTFPYNERRYVDNVYRLPGAGYGQDAPYICQVYSRDQVTGWLTASGATLVHQEYWRFFTGELWTFGEPLRPPREVSVDQPHHLSCLVLSAAEQRSVRRSQSDRQRRSGEALRAVTTKKRPR